MNRSTANIDARLAEALRTIPPSVAAKMAISAGAFRPVEPLLRRNQSDRKRPCRISEHFLAPIWAWIAEDVVPDAAQELVRTWIASELGVGDGDLGDVLARFHHVAGAAMRDQISSLDANERDALEVRLGGVSALSDAKDIAELMTAAARIDELFKTWPSDAVDTDPDQIKALKRLCDDSVRDDTNLPALIAALAIERIASVAAATELLVNLAGRRHAKRLDRTVFAPVIAGLVSDAGDGLGDGNASLEAFESVHSDLSTVAKAFEGCFEGPGLEWLGVEQANLRNAFERDLNDARQAALSVFEDDCAGLESDTDCGPGRFEAVEVGASFVVNAKDVASLLGAQATWNDANSAVASAVASSVVKEWLAVVGQQTELEQARTIAKLHSAVAINRATAGDVVAAMLQRQVQSAIGQPDLQSLVLQPLEPMIEWVDEPKEPGRIAATSVEAFWAWSRDELACDAIDAAEAAYAAAETTSQREQCEADLPALRVLTGNAALEALAGVSGADARQRWGERGRADFEEIAYVLAAGEAIEREMGNWPSQIRDMSEPHLASFRAVFDDVIRQHPDSGPTLLFYLLSRLARPAQILRVLARCTRHESDVAIEVTDYGVLGVALLDRATNCAKLFETSSQDSFDVERVLVCLADYAGIVSGMTEEFHIRPDGRWGRRLYSLRGRAGRRLELLCEEAVKYVNEATPRARTSRKGVEQANVSVPVREERWRCAAGYLHFINEARLWETRAGFAAAREKAADAIRVRMDSQIESLVTIAHGDDVEASEAAVAHLRALEPLVRGFEGDEAADLVLRRVAAAA